MRWLFKLLLIPIFFSFYANAANYNRRPVFDIDAFYNVLSGENLAEINTMLLTLKDTSFPAKSAYEGALLMKKAGLVKKPPIEKLNVFKSGRALLEAAIENDQENIEYHFLRLVIQENAPKIVGYHRQIQTDTELIRNSFHKLPPAVQNAVRQYSSKSIFLKAGDF